MFPFFTTKKVSSPCFKTQARCPINHALPLPKVHQKTGSKQKHFWRKYTEWFPTILMQHEEVNRVLKEGVFNDWSTIWLYAEIAQIIWGFLNITWSLCDKSLIINKCFLPPLIILYAHTAVSCTFQTDYKHHSRWSYKLLLMDMACMKDEKGSLYP